MDFENILNHIKKRWTVSERHGLLTELKEVPLGASTGGEVLHLYAEFLMNLKQNNSGAFDEIEDLMDEFAKESAAFGTMIKGYKYKPYWRS